MKDSLKRKIKVTLALFVYILCWIIGIGFNVVLIVLVIRLVTKG